MTGAVVLALVLVALGCLVACAVLAAAPKPNGDAVQRQMDLAHAQKTLSESMRDSGKHLLSGKKYVPETITIKVPVEKPANVSPLRRAKR